MRKSSALELSGELLEEDVELSLDELGRACCLTHDKLLAMVDEGVIEPFDSGRSPWRFRGVSLKRALKASRLESDLGVNLAGAALALYLLDELDRLHSYLQHLEKFQADAACPR